MEKKSIATRLLVVKKNTVATQLANWKKKLYILSLIFNKTKSRAKKAIFCNFYI
jgi:hypothetical protein